MQSTLSQFEEKRKMRRRLYSRTSIVVLFVLLCILAKATWGVYWKEQDSNEKKLRATASLAEFRAREDILNQDIARLKTEQGVEAEIRANYRMEKPDEHLVVIVDEPTKATPVKRGKIKDTWEAFKNLFR